MSPPLYNVHYSINLIFKRTRPRIPKNKEINNLLIIKHMWNHWTARAGPFGGGELDRKGHLSSAPLLKWLCKMAFMACEYVWFLPFGRISAKKRPLVHKCTLWLCVFFVDFLKDNWWPVPKSSTSRMAIC